MDRLSKQKINKETWVLNDTFDETDLTDIFVTFHPHAEEYASFSSTLGTFSRIDHKSSLSELKKIEIISSIFSDHDAMRLDINYKKKAIRNTNTWRLNKMFLKSQQVIKEMKREIKKISRNKWQWKHDNSNPMGCSKSSSKRKFMAIQSYLKKNIE